MATGYVTVFYFSVKLMAIIKHFVLSRKQMLLIKIVRFFASLAHLKKKRLTTFFVAPNEALIPAFGVSGFTNILVTAYLSFLCLLLL